MNSIEVRAEDRPLHEDMRYLTAVLGRVIRRLEGEEVFRAVEDLRTSSRDRRRSAGGAKALDALLAQVDALPLDKAAPVARAFTVFFFLINTAEQVHRVRRRIAYDKSGHVGPATSELYLGFRAVEDPGCVPLGRARDDARAGRAACADGASDRGHAAHAARACKRGLRIRCCYAMKHRFRAPPHRRRRWKPTSSFSGSPTRCGAIARACSTKSAR
ncbi:MAG: phosphoenolpyruvate carboxylase [Polyangiaceae bacterium]